MSPREAIAPSCVLCCEYCECLGVAGRMDKRLMSPLVIRRSLAVRTTRKRREPRVMGRSFILKISSYDNADWNR